MKKEILFICGIHISKFKILGGICMLYILAIFLPPVAVLLRGKPFQALINLGLTILFWLPGVIHAWIVINGANADARMKKQAKMIAEANRQQ